MIDRILVHHRLNGTRFSAMEFGLTGLVAGVIAVAAGAHDRWWLAVAAVGTVVNCAVVTTVAVSMWRRGERGQRIRALADPSVRATLGRQHPHLLADTLILTVTTLVPLVLTVWAGYDVLRREGMTARPNPPGGTP